MPVLVVRRLIKYLSCLKALSADGEAWVSSHELAEALDLTSSTVRQDFSHVEFSGSSKRGYDIDRLIEALSNLLNTTHTKSIVIVGAGNLGKALARHRGFLGQGFRMCAIFDSAPKVIGQKVGQLTVMGMSDLADAVKSEGVEIGIISVPSEAAQSVADQLVAAGVCGILNVPCTHIQVPEGVAVVEAHVVESLQELACLIKNGNGGE